MWLHKLLARNTTNKNQSKMKIQVQIFPSLKFDLLGLRIKCLQKYF